MDYAEFTGPDGNTDNMGGTTNRCWFAPKSYFTPLTGVKDVATLAAATTLDELSEITTTHTFQTGKGFHELYCTLDRGEGDFTAQGERDGRSFKGAFKGFYPGMDPLILGLFRKAKNDLFIFLVEMPDSVVLQFGSKRFYAEILADKIGTAKNSSGVRGTEFSVSFMESGPMLYSSTITLHP